MGLKFIWDCQNKLNEAVKKNKVSSIWVPDHSEIKEASTIARKGGQMPLTSLERFCLIGKNTYRKGFLEKTRNILT